MEKKRIELTTADRIIILGSTGDGKTTLSLEILAIVRPKRLVLINPGAEPKLYEIFGDSRPTLDTSFPSVQHVAPPIYRKKSEYGPLFWPIVLKGNVFSYYDEIAALATANDYSDGMMIGYQMGRRRNCGCVGVSQRTHRIPEFVINQADHIFAGHLQGRDLKKLETETQQPWAELMRTRKDHQFAYWSRHDAMTAPRFIN